MEIIKRKILSFAFKEIFSINVKLAISTVFGYVVHEACGDPIAIDTPQSSLI